MAILFWDASGLAKRYTVEIGSDVADALFDIVPGAEMLTTVWGYAETFSILLRKLNGGRLDQPTFNTAFAALKREIIGNSELDFLTIDEAAVLAGLPLMQRHNINATDAALLAVLLRYVQSRSRSASACVLIAADKRFIRGGKRRRITDAEPGTSCAKRCSGLSRSIMRNICLTKSH